MILTAVGGLGRAWCAVGLLLPADLIGVRSGGPGPDRLVSIAHLLLCVLYTVYRVKEDEGGGSCLAVNQ